MVRVIKQYVEDVEQEKRDAGAAPAAAEEMSQAALVRERTRRDEKQFWKNMSRVVPERTFRVWAALEGGLTKYNKLLKERSGVIDEVRRAAVAVVIRTQHNKTSATQHTPYRTAAGFVASSAK